MKRHIDITLDEEVIEHLNNEENKSKLINDLLENYFRSGGSNNIIALKERKMEIRDKLELLSMELKDITNQIEKHEKKEAEVTIKLGSIPSEIMNDFKEMDKLDENILRQRYYGKYQKEHDISWNQLLEAFRTFKEEEA